MIDTGFVSGCANSLDQLKHLEQLAKAAAAQADSLQCDQYNKLA